MAVFYARTEGLDMAYVMSGADWAETSNPGFRRVNEATATVYRVTFWNIAAGPQHDLRLTGTGFTYDAAGLPSGGIVTGAAYGHGPQILFDVSNAKLSAAALASALQLGGLDYMIDRLLAGNDRINGTGANDYLYGFAGADTIDGKAGGDTMFGSSGNDTYIVDKWTRTTPENWSPLRDEVREGSGQGSDTVKSSVTYDLPDNVEHLILTGSLAINGTGNAAANSLTGNRSANTLRGGQSGDTLKGESGADILLGEGANDRLYGGLGNDTLRGDLKTAWTGIDRFYFDTTPNSTTNRDTIVDFDASRDFIHLSLAVFTKAGPVGTLAQDAFYTVGVGRADAEDRIIYNQATGALSYDPDGTGAAAAVQFANVTAGMVLGYADFIVY